ncbi:small subunit ribosomal protein S24e [Pancytospora philotis]|nr:small subunit ribosomal protein S24e [Pancytospora philotis]
MAISIKVTKFNTNALLSRRELELSITHRNQSTPNKEVITSELSSNYAVPAGQIYVHSVKTGFGIHESVARAHMYNSTDDLKKIERAFVTTRLTGEAPFKVKRITKKQERVKRRNIFGTEKRNMEKAKRRIKD